MSPLRIEKNSPGWRGFFDIQYFDLPKYFKLIYQRIYNILRDQKLVSLPPYSAPQIPALKLLDKNLIWLDVAYGKSEQAAKTLGGLLGTLQFQADLDDMWKQILWLGQFFHVGQAKSFGFGRYHIRHHIDDSSSEQSPLITAEPARSFLNRAIDIGNMQAAFEHVEDNRGMPGIDEQTIHEISDRAYDYLSQLINDINTRQYKPRELLGIIIDSAGNKPRALAIPTVKDRILQRAVVQILSPLINLLLEDSSYAY